MASLESVDSLLARYGMRSRCTQDRHLCAGRALRRPGRRADQHPRRRVARRPAARRRSSQTTVLLRERKEIHRDGETHLNKSRLSALKAQLDLIDTRHGKILLLRRMRQSCELGRGKVRDAHIAHFAFAGEVTKRSPGCEQAFVRRQVLVDRAIALRRHRPAAHRSSARDEVRCTECALHQIQVEVVGGERIERVCAHACLSLTCRLDTAITHYHRLSRPRQGHAHRSRACS